MLARTRAEGGFTTIELLIAVVIGGVGLIALVGTLDVSRRLTSYSEMKEAASHVAEQKIEEMRALDYGELALNGNPSPASSTGVNDPPYYLGTNAAGAKTYLWNQKSGATNAAEPLFIDATAGKVAATAQPWSDGRIGGKIYRYVTCASTVATDCDQGPNTSATKRITVAVTVENKLGPQKPILVSTLVGNPSVANGEGANPLDSPNTSCVDDGVPVECTQGIPGTVRTWYLYDTPATQSTHQEITGSHPTHPTVAPGGTCTSTNTSGCPVPDLMSIEPPPSPSVTPPVYNYSNEMAGGSGPGGAVVRRDAECGGTVTSTDNTKGHLWVSAPLSAPVKLSGDAALNVSTQTFNGVTAAAMLCVRFLNVPGNLSNLVATPPTTIGSSGYSLTSWPRSPSTLGFALDFLGDDPAVSIPAGNRIGVRVWVAASSATDLVVLYDHPMHPTFVQINEAD
jgi:type II secretory pathway pseudopilin PulG